MMGLVGVLVCGVALGAAPKASSEGVGDDGTRHSAAHAFDGLLSTGWAEGDLGDGVGAWLEVRFDAPVDVASVSVYPGWLGGTDRQIREYGRPKLVTLTFEVAGGPPVTRQERLLDPGESGPLRHDVMIDVPKAKSLRIVLDEVLSGPLHSDTFIAEVAINLVAGKSPGLDGVVDWLKSDPGTKAAEAQRLAAIALFEQAVGSTFGDRDSLKTLMDWAADGAPYLRDKVGRVPYGFRTQALLPDKTAVEALLKLKDSNAIAAIERASLRVTGALAQDLARRAKLFDAYQELLGGSRPAPPWGQPGIGKGSLKGMGEPLDLVVDNYGGLYVADVANNRVQRFSIDSGVVDNVWGAKEPAVVETWLGSPHDGYAAGASAGDAPGQFANPVDLALVPGKDGDGMLVLDAAGRVSHVLPNGEVKVVGKIEAEGNIGPGVGGEGHLLYHKGKAVVIWGNEGFVLSVEDGTALGRFPIADGVPHSAVMFSNGKMGLVFRGALVMYSTDGFRHGDLLGDVLGTGFQDWAVAIDERKKLWAVLDTGEVVKFKKPGKVDFRVTVGTYSFDNPRLAVFGDTVFISEKDRILHADALALREKAASGSGGAGMLEIPE